MISQFPPAPSWADPIIVENNPATGQPTSKFNPQWLKWFLDVAALLSSGGGGGGQGDATIGNVRGPTVSVDGDIALFDGLTGLLIKDGGVLGTDLVHGPDSAVDGNLPSFDGTTGKKIKDSGVLADDVVVGPVSCLDEEVAVFDGITGKIIKGGADVPIKTPSTIFSTLPGTPTTGMLMVITDSSVNTWGSVVAGGGSKVVLCFYNGSDWTVAGK